MTVMQRLGIFVRDLLQQPEGSVVQIGRTNMRRDDFSSLQIVLDRISPATLTSKNRDYDPEAEVMKYIGYWSAPCTINFYGDSASSEATKFILLCQSQAGYELQRDIGMGIYDMSGLTDVKLLTGEQYSERLEVAFNVRYSEAVEVETLRIDSASGTILTDNPIGQISWQT